MKNLKTFEEFVNENLNKSNTKIRQEVLRKSGGIDKDSVVFTLDDEKLDQLLYSKFYNQIDVQKAKDGDEYYVLSQRDFDRFMDLADSSGFDVDYENSEDSVIYVYESKALNESDAYTISRMANDIGLGPAQEFLDNYDIDIKLLTKDISQGTINKYELRDIIRGNVQSSKIKKFIKTYVNERLNESDYEYLELSDGKTTVSLYREGGKWHEDQVIRGKKPYGWGQKTYMSYLSPDEIADYLSSDYNGNWEVILKESENLNEAKKPRKGADLVKIFKDTKNWGSIGTDQVYTKGNNLVFIDGWYYGQEKALNNLVKSWSPGGDYYDYFLDEYKIDVEIVDTFTEFQATGRHKKLTDTGVVGVELKINQLSLNENFPGTCETHDDKYIDYGKMKTLKTFEEFVNESIDKSSEVKQIEKIVKKYFSGAKYDSNKYQWVAKTKVNPKDDWAQPLDLIKFDNEASKKWYSFLAGNSWDNDGNIIIKLRSNKLLESEDHEVKMSTNQLEAVINSALDLKEKIGEMEKDIPAWIQDHISQAYNYLKQANDGYHELDESINTRLRSEIFVNLKRAGFVPDEDFEYSRSQLYAKDMEVAKDIVDELADKYRFSIQDKRITKEGKVPINVGRK